MRSADLQRLALEDDAIEGHSLGCLVHRAKLKEGEEGSEGCGVRYHPATPNPPEASEMNTTSSLSFR